MASIGCDCDQMVRLLRAMGERGVDPDDDLEEHFREEERAIPRLVAMGRLPKSVMDRIFAEHKKFRLQIRQYGSPDPEALKLHALYEDDVVKRFFPDV